MCVPVVKVVAECLALSSSEQTQELAQHLLHQLFTVSNDITTDSIPTLTHIPSSPKGNPHYQSQVYKALIGLLPSSSPTAQRMAANTLREIQVDTVLVYSTWPANCQYVASSQQPSMGAVSVAIVEPTLLLLRSLHADVQYEGTVYIVIATSDPLPLPL